jgi:acetyl esterase/lipase
MAGRVLAAIRAAARRAAPPSPAVCTCTEAWRLKGAVAIFLGLATQAAFAAQPSALEAQYGPAALKGRESHGAVDVLAQGQGASRVYLFLPAQPSLSGRVPVVFFHHGWQGMDPKNYGALIDHLVREGQVVVYPVYQNSAQTSPQLIVGYAAAADRAAMAMLAARRLTPDPARILYFGYSMGAAISLDLALAPARYGLPAPRAMVLLAPGDAPAVATGPEGASIIGDLRRLPKTLPVAVMTGAQDTQIGLPTARAIFPRLCGILPDRRVLMILPGDSHGGATVHAQHGAPGAPDPRYDFALSDQNFPVLLQGQPGFAVSPSLNQLDFYGFWKVTDALVASLPAGPLPGVVFGHGDPAQLYLGVWPDGAPYKPLRLENPCAD